MCARENASVPPDHVIYPRIESLNGDAWARARRRYSSIARSMPRSWLLFPVGLAFVTVVWAVVALTIPGVHFVLLDPKIKTGFEVFLAVVSLFVALVLFLFPEEPTRDPLRWVAFGFLTLGAGSLALGYFYPALVGPLDIQTGVRESLLAPHDCCRRYCNRSGTTHALLVLRGLGLHFSLPSRWPQSCLCSRFPTGFRRSLLTRMLTKHPPFRWVS